MEENGGIGNGKRRRWVMNCTHELNVFVGSKYLQLYSEIDR